MLSSRLNIAFAVFCVLSLACGVTLSVVTSKLMDFIIKRDSDISAVFALLWIVGFAYIIPGASGLLATGLRKRISYMIHSFLGLTSVIILTILYCQGLVASQQASGGHFCHMHEGKCKCENSQLQSLLKFFYCDDINYMVRMGMASDAMFFGGGVVTFISAIMSLALSNQLVKVRTQQSYATLGIGLSETNVSGAQHQFNQSSGSEDLNNQTPGGYSQYRQPIVTSFKQAFVSFFKN